MTEILEELEWKDDAHRRQTHEAEDAGAVVVVNVAAEGAKGAKHGRRRARNGKCGGGAGLAGGTFGRPADWSQPTRHLYRPGPPGRLSALSICRSTSSLYGIFCMGVQGA